jgi:hypothetical protein
LAAVFGVKRVFFKLHPKQFKKAENIGFDRLGNKNLRPFPSPPRQSARLILLLPMAMDFCFSEREFSSGFVENQWGRRKPEARSQEPEVAGVRKHPNGQAREDFRRNSPLGGRLQRSCSTLLFEVSSDV